jgi:hypothetical protein
MAIKVCREALGRQKALPLEAKMSIAQSQPMDPSRAKIDIRQSILASTREAHEKLFRSSQYIADVDAYRASEGVGHPAELQYGFK